MKASGEMIGELKLDEKQAAILKSYFEDSVIELLDSLKQDNLQNFEETINSIRNTGN